MNAQELKKDMELVNSSIHGAVKAQWGVGHFWFGIYQECDESERLYTWTYIDVDSNNQYGTNEYYTYKTIDDLFAKHDPGGYDPWHRCLSFPDLANYNNSRRQLAQPTKDMENIIGKKIIKVTKMKNPDYDDVGWLKLDFADNTYCVIQASYTCYTGASEDEYPTDISILDTDKDLVPC